MLTPNKQGMKPELLLHCLSPGNLYSDTYYLWTLQFSIDSEVNSHFHKLLYPLYEAIATQWL